MAETEPSVRITLKDVYTQVQEMKSILEKLSEVLPSTAEKLEKHEAVTNKILADHEERLRRVEMRIWQMMAIVAVLATLVPLAVRLIPQAQ